MKRALRILWNAVAAASALLCIAMIVWWTAGESSQLTVRPYADQDSWALTLGSSAGRCIVEYGPILEPVFPKPDRLEFNFTFDCWKAVVAFAVLPTIWFGLLMQRKKSARQGEAADDSAPNVSPMLQPKLPNRAWVTLALLLLIVLFWIVTSASNRYYGFSTGKLHFSPENGVLFLRYSPQKTAMRGEYLGAYGFVFFGFQAYQMKYARVSNYTLVIPDWATAVVLMIILWRQLRPWMKARKAFARIAAGCCARCGYDLRGSSGRCPECGAIANGNENS